MADNVVSGARLSHISASRRAIGIGADLRRQPSETGLWLGIDCSRNSRYRRNQDVSANAPEDKELTDKWNWDFADAAEKVFQGWLSVGMPLGTTSTRWIGRRCVRQPRVGAGMPKAMSPSNPMRPPGVEWFRRRCRSSHRMSSLGRRPHNKWLVAGKGALIMNPPSAWAVGAR